MILGCGLFLNLREPKNSRAKYRCHGSLRPHKRQGAQGGGKDRFSVLASPDRPSMLDMVSTESLLARQLYGYMARRTLYRLHSSTWTLWDFDGHDGGMKRRHWGPVSAGRLGSVGTRPAVQPREHWNTASAGRPRRHWGADGQWG